MNGENYYSGFERNHFDEYAQNGFNELLDISPESYLVGINDQKLKVIIQQTTKDNILQILGNEGSFSAGDLVFLNEDKYLILIKPQFNQMYLKSKMERCNFDLKWIDSEGTLREFPCVLYYNARSNFGTEEDKVMNLPAGRRQIAVSSNEHTVKLERDARFIIGSEAFKVIDADYMSDDGLVNLSLQSDQINLTTDNLELGIADYNKLAKYNIEILNGDMLAIKVGDNLQLNVKTTKNGKPVEIPLLFNVSDDSVVTVSETGLVTALQKGSCTITVEGMGVRDQIDLNIIEDVVPNYTAEITGSTTIYFNKFSSYRTIFRNNGIEISDGTRYWLTAIDGVSKTDLATIESQDAFSQSCNVKAGSQRGNVILHVKNDNGLSSGQYQISIRSLI